jgi:outer membrane protein OmpA-like peptidoglycan-associated protein
VTPLTSRTVRSSLSAALRLAAALAIAALGAAWGAAAANAQSVVVPRVDKLVFIGAAHEERGDFEAIVTIGDVTPTQYVMAISADIPNASDPEHPKRLRLTRTVRIIDDSTAHKLNTIFASDDPQIFPGATPGNFSAVMLQELKTSGRTSVVYGDAPPGAFAGMLAMFGSTRKYYRGDLVRGASTTIPVMVNGVRTQLPVIEVKGHLTVGNDVDDVDLFVLDNPHWPLVLKGGAQGRSGQVTEIEWPLDQDKKGSGGALEAGLTKTCRAEVHGIYFAFGSAELVPESDLALKQVAQLLAANPSWTVTIEGHTDNIGKPQANLDLSKRRSAAVRDALVTRFAVPPARLQVAGFGDTRPIEANVTIEGRARNRRVELARKC